MISFTEFAPAKINLALHVLGRRADGFHEIDSIVAFADVGDELRFDPTSEFFITASGPFADDLPGIENNIIYAAWRAISEIAKARGKKMPHITVSLTKNLPVAAGIGGGSADAAAAIRGFLRLAEMKIDQEIAKAALSLGADIPVCLVGKACRMQGMGERITPLIDFRPLPAVLINPLIAVRTSDVFHKLGLKAGEKHKAPLLDLLDPISWRNDLMAPSTVIVPEIAQVIAALERQQGLSFVRMSGSGATSFGVFETVGAAQTAAQELAAARPRWWIRFATLE